MTGQKTSTDPCADCGGTGWVLTETDGIEIVTRCRCAEGRIRQRLLGQANIPARYEHCTFDSFEVDWFKRCEGLPHDGSLKKALGYVREFADLYPEIEKGLLLMGGLGTGKTHLAVAALKYIMAEKPFAVRGRFADFTSLVLEIQMTFGGSGSSKDLLQPLVDADLLVLDELGAGKTTPWVLDLLYYLVNTRYLSGRATIFTTNYVDKPRNGEESLADRVSGRIRSRLHEMCRRIDFLGHDFRAEVLKSREGFLHQ